MDTNSGSNKAIQNKSEKSSTDSSQTVSIKTSKCKNNSPLSRCFVVIRIQNHEFQTAVYSSLALFEIYKLHIVSVSEK